ncbi:MAG TPA: hypothetical protein VHX65_01785 [Pirellulales bacterium]|nr:hypothetical protein [Pirellulales bacterium]
MDASHSADVAAEIDALLFGDLTDRQAETAPATAEHSEAAQAEGPKYFIPPTEVPHPDAAGAETSSHLQVPSVELPHVETRKPAGDSIADARSPDVGLPPPLPSAAFAPPPQSQRPPQRDHEFQLQPQLDLPEAASSRMQHVIEAAAEEEEKKHQAELAKASEKAEKFTPHATLADPHRAFLSGVFEFPFYLDVLPQWIKLAFTLTLELTLAWWIIELSQHSAGRDFWTSGIAIGSLVMLAPAVLFGFIWIAMTWAVGSSILEDTAAGMNHIDNWPESLVLDDLPSLVFPAVGLFLSALPGVTIAWLSGKSVPEFWFIAPSIVLLFPFVLLSILETGSVFVPFSMPVFRCLRKRPGTWIWFYGESTIVITVAALTSVPLWLKGEWPRFAFAAVLATAAIIIYFRLLGRLALVCANQAIEWTEDEPDAEAETVTDDDGPDQAVPEPSAADDVQNHND